jgi:hypothetical protein
MQLRATSKDVALEVASEFPEIVDRSAHEGRWISHVDQTRLIINDQGQTEYSEPLSLTRTGRLLKNV